MVVLPDSSIFEILISKKNDKLYRKLINILYNENVNIILNGDFLNLLSREIEENDIFQAYIKELNDTKRIINIKTTTHKSFDDIFTHIANSHKSLLFFPITIVGKDKCNKIPRLIAFDTLEFKNKHWIGIELLSQNILNICYKDFVNDSEIQLFFNSLFELIGDFNHVLIFNRDPEYNFLNKLKGKSIDYYSLVKTKGYNNSAPVDTKNELRKKLGGKLNFYFTNNSSILHERKIIIENILITIDNALNNLSTSEPTWEVIVNYDKIKSHKWKEKCSKFRKT